MVLLAGRGVKGKLATAVLVVLIAAAAGAGGLWVARMEGGASDLWLGIYTSMLLLEGLLTFVGVAGWNTLERPADFGFEK